MPITIEYQPSFVAGGQIAYDAGRGRFLQEQDRFNLSQDQLGEQQRQFDQRLQFAAQEAALRDDQLRRQMGQRGAIANAQLAYQDMNQRRSLQAGFAREQMQQAGWADRNQQQLQLAKMQVDARQAQAQQTQQFQAAMNEQQQIQQYVQQNAAVLSPEQVAGITSQWEAKHGLPWGFDQQAVIEAQQAQQELAVKRIESAAVELGMPDGAFEKGLITFGTDKSGNSVPILTPPGEAWVRRKEMELKETAALERVQVTEETKRRELEQEQLQQQVEEQKAAQQELADQQKKQQEQWQKQQEEMRKRQREFADQSRKAMMEMRTAQNDPMRQVAGEETPFDAAAFDWPMVLTKEDYDLILPGVVFYKDGKLYVKGTDGKPHPWKGSQ